jgi:DNA sulfur modification protein DndD
MKFRKLTIENYKSFQFATEIRFPVGEDGRSIFLIGGMNGAGKTSIMEAVNFCLYGAKMDEIFRSINRREKARGNASVSFELVMEMDDLSELVVKRSWSAGVVEDPKPKDLTERLVVVRDGKRVSVQNQEIWQDFIRSMIPPSITQFFFFDGEKIQAIAADDHSEVRLKSSLEAALGIQYINRLAADILYIKNEERKGFVEISDEDLDFKQSELKKERSKLTRRQKDRERAQQELAEFKQQLDDARQRFAASFHTEPETRETMRANEKKRVQAANRLAQVESEIRALCEKTLPFAITGRLFEPMRQQIEAER